MLQTQYEFTLPKGYMDEEGNLHKNGIMRLATAMDEIRAMRDPRVMQNPDYAAIIILSHVIIKLGSLLRDSLGCLFFCRSHRSIGATIQLILLPL